MKYQLFDIRLNHYFGSVERMTPRAALEANRDLLLAGEKSIGWKLVEETPAPPRPPRKVAPVKRSPPDGLVDALISLGYGKTEAKRLASQFDGGSIEDCLRQLMVVSQ